MKNRIDKIIVVFLIMIISINAIFPCIAFAYTQEEITELCKKEADEKINEKIEEWLQANGKQYEDLTEQEKQEIVKYLNDYIGQFNLGNVLDGYQSYAAIENDPRIDKEQLKYDIWEYIGEVELSEYVENYTEEREPINTSPEISAPNTWYDFEVEIRKWLEEKLEQYATDEEKLEYLNRFASNWRDEVWGAINPGILDKEECDQIVRRLVEEKKQVISAYTSTEITKEQARTLLINRLAELRIEQETKLEGLDAETKRLRLQEYFQDLKNKHIQATGDFYQETVAIAEKIRPVEDKSEFLSSVPSYIEQFISDNLGEPVTILDIVFGLFSVTIDAVAGVYLYIPKVLFLIIPGAILETVETLLASIGTENGILGIDKWLTIDHIFFNEVALTDINIFDFETAANSPITEKVNVLWNLRKNIAGWYYAIRNLSIALGLAVLVYTGIRIAISTIAEDKAKYKKMLKDWLVSFALIFVLQYFMIFVIQLNDGIVGILAEAKKVQEQELAIKIPIIGVEIQTQSLQSRLLLEAFHPLFTRGLTATVLYIMLVGMTFLFLIVYVKRLITISFLVMISPLITITYAIDKAGDGKAQALNKWMKEFVFNILIQPFHCIIYMVFLQNIFYVINDTTGVLQFGKIFVAIIMLGFIYKAEDIVKAIFGFEANNLSSAAALGALAISKTKNISKLKSNMSGVKGAGAKARDVKNVKTPDTLPSKAGNLKAAPEDTRAKPSPAQTATQSGGTQKAPNKFRTMAGKMFQMGTGTTARKLAGRILAAALGYGLTGEYGGAIGADKAVGAAGKKLDEMKLSSRVKEKKEGMLDAMQDYQEANNLSDDEMLDKASDLLKANVDDIENDQDRNLAGWLQANQETQRILGSKNPQADVMNQLRDYYMS